MLRIIMLVNLKKKIKFLYKIIYQSPQITRSIRILNTYNICKLSIGGADILVTILLIRSQNTVYLVDYIDGLIYEILFQISSPILKKILAHKFKNGIVPLKSKKDINYLPLQKLLVHKQFQAANSLTYKKLCELSNLCSVQRSWLYFTDISLLPTVDLQTIDKLWRIHSLDKFGFSVQRQIWLLHDRDWNRLLQTIEWKINNVLCRYPNEFQWNINGPAGHLPLLNQLYGVQPLLTLFKHEAWKYVK